MGRRLLAITLVLITVVLWGLPSSAASSQPGHPPTGWHSHPLGWSFQLPAGWRVRDVSRATALAPPGTTYEVTRGDLGQVYAVTAVDEIATPDDADVVRRLVRTLAHNGWQPLGDARRDTLAESGRSIVVYTWSFRHARRAVPMETRVYLAPDPAAGVTPLLLAASERDAMIPLHVDLLRLASSLKFSSRNRLGPSQWKDWGFQREKPPGPGMPDPGDVLADESVPSQQWLFYLRGKRITPTPGKADPHQSLDLHDDGTFQEARAGTALTGSSRRGRWRIVTRAAVTALVLYWQHGETTYHRLERRGNVIIVDETPTTVVRVE